MTLRKILYYSFIIIGCSNCNTNNKNKGNSYDLKSKKIIIQSFENIDYNIVKSIKDSINIYYDSVEIKENKILPPLAYYQPRDRYKADSILKYLSDNAESNEVVIGITTKDISTSKGNIADFGVMGLGRCPGNVCVASSFRLNKENVKSQLFKVAIHKLGHTFGLPHCPNKSCFMRDAEGKNPTDEERGFCDKCSGVLKNKNWKL